MSAVLAFLGGSAFRMIWEWFVTATRERAEHKREIERMRLQAEMDAAAHERNMASMKLQHEMGVEVIRVTGEQVLAEVEMGAWGRVVEAAVKPTGIFIVDLWNGVIRPLAASIAIWLWVCALNAQGFKMTEWDRELVGVVLGFFFATRTLLPGRK